jgi:RNA polymerase sigma-70 factor (ECF subfamily)
MASKEKNLSANSDEEIVLLFRETADNDCFAELFARHRKKVYLACRHFFGDSDRAEDATQEAFLRAYQNMDRYEEGKFSAWLIRIARNACIDQWRKRRSEIAMEDSNVSRMPATGFSGASSELFLAAAKVQQEMKSLPVEQRRCLELKIEGYSYEETAVKTGFPVEAVKSHLQNGRRMLWLKLEGMPTQIS